MHEEFVMSDVNVNMIACGIR